MCCDSEGSWTNIWVDLSRNSYLSHECSLGLQCQQTIWSSLGAVRALSLHAYPNGQSWQAALDWTNWLKARTEKVPIPGRYFLVARPRIAPSAIWTIKGIMWMRSCPCSWASVLWTAMPNCRSFQGRGIKTARSGASFHCHLIMTWVTLDQPHSLSLTYLMG